MSRIGNRILQIPSGTTITNQKNKLVVQGPKGQVEITLKGIKNLDIKIENDTVTVKRLNEEKNTKMCHGTINALIKNALFGVNNLWKIKLNLVGVGYKAASKGNTLNLTLGYSHPINLEIPKDILVTTPTPNEIIIEGPNKDGIGQFASIIRKYRMPEPYKGKGVLFENEKIIRKSGKTAEGSKK